MFSGYRSKTLAAVEQVFQNNLGEFTLATGTPILN